MAMTVIETMARAIHAGYVEQAKGQAPNWAGLSHESKEHYKNVARSTIRAISNSNDVSRYVLGYVPYNPQVDPWEAWGSLMSAILTEGNDAAQIQSP